VVLDRAVGALAGADHVCIGVGPHRVLTEAVSRWIGDEQGRRVFHSLQRSMNERMSMLAALGGLYSAGCSVDWTAQVGPSARCVQLPTYPWQRERFWIGPTRRTSLGDQLWPRRPDEARTSVATASGQVPLLAHSLYEATWAA